MLSTLEKLFYKTHLNILYFVWVNKQNASFFLSLFWLFGAKSF